jgi:uncharacterized protein YabN with tetrapyrrole methylase and pyrophosphatase domain
MEAAAVIRAADKVFYVCADMLTAYWINELNPRCESLNSYYEPGKDRRLTYDAMVTRVVDAVTSGLNVCFAVYGHPGVFADPPHESVRRARAAGCVAEMLPAISADACLYADLGVDPAESGCQSYEATDFLIHHRRFDPRSALVLWQIGVMGERSFKPDLKVWNRDAVRILTDVLLEHYPREHRVTVYEAARYPGCSPVISETALADLPHAPISSISTLYVPPFGKAERDDALFDRLLACSTT